MKSAGIDIALYSGHSTRSTSVSSCKAESLSDESFRAVQFWYLAKFYHKPIDTVASFGNMVLRQQSDTYLTDQDV